MEGGTQKRPLWRAIRELRARDDRPHHVANVVLRLMGVTKPPVDVESIATRLGVKVVRLHSPGYVGSIDSTVEPATIRIDCDNAPVRIRFTLAHELGHLLLHPTGRMMRDSTFARVGDIREEEANDFAAALLMPLWLLEPIITGSKRSAFELANLFDVSHGALSLQLRKLT